jgi:hypothetical protein
VLQSAAMRQLILLVAFACGSFACGGGPSAPSGPSYPSVAGSYAGTITITYPELGAQITCPATTAATQTNASVNLAPLVLGGQCGNMSIPLGPQTIDINGALTGNQSGSMFEPSCGGTYNYTASGGFFGTELRIAINATSAVCWNFNFTATLRR